MPGPSSPSNPFINAYKSIQDIGAEALGLDSRDGAPIPQQFQKVFDGVSNSPQASAVEKTGLNIFLDARDGLRNVDAGAKLAAEGKANHLDVATAVNDVKHAAETLTTSVSKALQAYQSIVGMQL